MNLSEQHLYGSSRLGVWNRKVNMDVALPTPYTTPGLGTINSTVFERGSKAYELSNHLGNVLVTISDRKFGIPSPGNSSLIDHSEADVLSTQDYYPFGMAMPGRKSGGYRYGFNGKENDGEIKGDGNQYDFGERIYDPRTGRFLSCDRVTPYTPFYSPYLFAGNKPIVAIDQNGDIEIIVHFHTTTVDPISGKRTTTHTSTKLDILTVQDLRSRPRTPAEVNVYILNTAAAQRNGNMTNYVWSSSLNAIEDKKNTGITAAEAEKANSPVPYALNETFKTVAKGIGVRQLTEAAVGEDIETGEKKSVTERWVDFADGVVTALSMGRMGVTARLKTWAKDAARDAIVEKSIPMMMDILGIKDKTERFVFGYYIGLALKDVAGGKLTRIKDAVIKSLEIGVKGAGQITKELKAMGIDLKMPKDKDAALRQAVTGQLSQYNSSSDQEVKSQYEKKHD